MLYYLTLLKKKKKKQVIFKCTASPDFVIPCNHKTHYRCSLTTVAQDKPYHKKPFSGTATTIIRKVVPYSDHIHYSTIIASISFSSFLRVSTRQFAVSSLSKGISSILNFHESIRTDGTRSCKLTHQK